MSKRSKILAGLNAEQRRAVEATEGPVLVLAGAGTGKTRVITVRVAHLLDGGVSPKNVLAVTFTNKAAAEMAERVGGLVGKKRAGELTIGTFHAFCARTLREHGSVLGIPKRFAICDAADQLAAFRRSLRELRIPEASIQPRALQAAVSLAKNRGETAETFLAGAADDRDELIGRAWRKYEEQKARSRSLDFDDLLLEARRLLTESTEVQGELRRKYRYVLVDEYQDTNGVQYEILKLIAAEHRNLCAVGDDDQSIYGWRGADVRNILGFEKDYHGALVVRLETNYRSTNQILSAANRLIANNPKRHDKELRSALGDGPVVTSIELRDEVDEADHVVREVQDLARETGLVLGDVAVLFRTQTQPRAFETQFRARGVPYVLIGGMSFFDRKEVRDVLAYLKLLANRDDEVSLLRIVNCPPRGVGKGSVEKAVAFATTHGISATKAFERADEIEGIPPATAAAVQAMLAQLGTLASSMSRIGLVEGTRRLLDAVGYRGEVDRCYPEERERENRWAAVMEVLNTAENYTTRRKKPTLAGFLEEVALTANDERKDDAGRRNAVSLMTIHAAKGLEFTRVYLVGMEEGLLPHARAVADDSVEEERRLAYVGVTRAKRSLILTLSSERAKFGRRTPSHASRFLYEIRGETPPKGWVPAGALEPAPPRGGKKRGRRRTAGRSRK